MYASEIHAAMDREDLNLVWELMFKRTAWIQNNTPSIEGVARMIQETTDILDRLTSIQEDTKEKITQAMLTQHAIRAYREWA